MKRFRAAGWPSKELVGANASPICDSRNLARSSCLASSPALVEDHAHLAVIDAEMV
jgi:hypothetical protein